MTPKEKAEELFNQYANVIYQRALTTMQYEICKQCALIAVDEILSICKQSLDLDHFGYWLEVKQKIQSL